MSKERLEHANELIRLISSYGRQFFNHEGQIASFHLDRRGRVWFLDEYTKALIYTHYSGRWRKFNHGGTMRDIVERLRDYIKKDDKLPISIICPERRNIDDGNIWGYPPAEAKKLRDACKGLPVFISTAAM